MKIALTRRRLLLSTGAAALASAAWPVAAQAKLPKLTLAGPFAAVSNPLIRIADSGALADVAKQMEFVTYG